MQRAPKLLDLAQQLIDKKKTKFALSGSSARKLRRGAANLLAGRAYTYSLFPLLSCELDNSFNINQALAFGTLPHVWNVESDEERVIYLRSYVTTYLKEEISEEQIVRKIEPFAKFLQVAAQSNGQLINYKKISLDTGVSDQTIKTYFQILEDTLLGFVLPSWHRSNRKSLSKTPKFYLFDTGILRSLNRSVNQPLLESNYLYGNLFKTFVIAEIKNTALYHGKDFQYYFLRQKDGKEIDLIIDRPGQALAVIEIKSTKNITKKHTELVNEIGPSLGENELFVLSQDENEKLFDNVRCLHWREGVKEIIGKKLF